MRAQFIAGLILASIITFALWEAVRLRQAAGARAHLPPARCVFSGRAEGLAL